MTGCAGVVYKKTGDGVGDELGDGTGDGTGDRNK